MGSTNASKRHAEKKFEMETEADVDSTGLTKRPARQWKILDLVSFALMASVAVVFILIFTSLGDSLATAGQLELDASASSTSNVSALSSSSFWDKVESGEIVPFCSDRHWDHMPCHDPRRAVTKNRERSYYKERHCPPGEEKLKCLIPSPPQYQPPVPWPESLQRIWYSNVPHAKVTEGKINEHWIKRQGDYFVFPGGIPEGRVKYVQQLANYIPFDTGAIRTALDVGCGDASFGAYLLKVDVLTMSFAPRDSRKPQVQFALERGIPAMIGTLGTQRLPLPSFSFDLVHCSRCFTSFSEYNGSCFLEMDRILRGGGFFVLSGPPVRSPAQEEEWAILQELAIMKLCYTQVVVEESTVVWQKPQNSSCYRSREEQIPAICPEDEDPNKACTRALARQLQFERLCGIPIVQVFGGYQYFETQGSRGVDLNDCITRLPAMMDIDEDRGLVIPTWPRRLERVPQRVVQLLNDDGFLFDSDMRRWRRRLKFYKETLGLKIGSSRCRNFIDMNAVYGGFAANLVAEPVWVMNVVPVFGAPNTLHAIYDRGLIGVLHDWCEAFSTYPRSYDFIHANNLQSFTSATERCSLAEVIMEMDRILRPEGMVVVHDSIAFIERVSKVAKAVRWIVEVFNTEAGSAGKTRFLVARKQLLNQKSPH